MQKGQSCGTCIHFFPKPKPKEGEEPQGQCRHGPPQIVMLVGEAEQPQFVDGKIHVVKQQINKPQPMFAPMLARDPGCGQFVTNETKLCKE